MIDSLQLAAMQDDLVAEFLPRFAAKSRARLARARAAAVERLRDGMTTTIADLHSIAGDAGLLGAAAVCELAARCEASARAARDAAREVDFDALVVALDELRAAIDGCSPA